MCIAAPMEIIEINQARTTATGVLNGNSLEIDIRLISPKIGDFVLVHAGCALEIIGEETALDISNLLLELEELAKDDGR